MQLDLFHIIKTYDKELKHEMYEAYVTSEKFSISVPSIRVVFIELNTICDIWNGKLSQFSTVICIL